MILTCSKCSTNYRVDHSQLSPLGKNVKCSKCGHIWFQKFIPQEEEIILKPEAIPSNSSLPVVVEHYTPIWLKFMPTMFLCLIVISIVFFYQKEIISLFPRSIEFYDSIGLPETNQLTFEDVSISKKKNYIDINGLIQNNSKINRMLPKISITTSNGLGETIFSAAIFPPHMKIGPGESNPFHKRLINFPKESVYLTISLSDRLDVLSMKVNS